MKTRKIYVCGIGEVLSIAPTVFKGVNKVLYRVHNKIRLAKLVQDKLTGEKRYKLLVNGLEVNEGFEHAKEIGELFVIAPTSLLMSLEEPELISKRMKRKALLRYESLINGAGVNEDVIGEEIEPTVNIDELIGHDWAGSDEERQDNADI